MFRRHGRLCAAAAAAAVAANAGESASSCLSESSSLMHAVESVSPMPVYLKPSSSPQRKASFYFPRMREKCPPGYAFQPSSLGTALPLFSITSSSCEYYALRLPLLKAGFRRVPAEARDVASNLVWGRSMRFCEMLRDGQPTPLLDFAAADSSEQAAYMEKLRMVNSHQRYNHFPLSHANIGCKRGMAVNVRRAFKDAMQCATTSGERKAVQSRYSYVPRTWFYPQERESLVTAMKASPSDRHFIWKPSRGSCGRGILISQGGTEHAPSWERIMEEIDCKAASKETRRLFSSYVVQEYIENPLLVEGRKVDLRLYVAVTSYNPLTVYWHEEGLVRFAAEPYSDTTNSSSSSIDCGGMEVGDGAVLPGSLAGSARHESAGSRNRGNNHSGSVTPSAYCTKHMHDRFRHLTNYSVGRRYVAMHGHGRSILSLPTETNAVDGDAVLPELKWSLQRLWDYIDACGESTVRSRTGVAPARRASDAVREEIAQLITRTLMAVRPVVNDAVRRVPMPGSYFELYGFDVMLDASLNPFLIEVNTLPSLESSSTFDYSTKTNVVADLLNLAMLEPFERNMAPGSTLWNSSRLREDLHGPLAAKDRGLFHIAEAGDVDVVARGNAAGTREDVELRMRDELAYARGFHRIFPAKTLSGASSQKIERESSVSISDLSAPPTLHQPLDSLAMCPSYLADLHAYESQGLLSAEDTWALAS
ncbi:tubulin-tyrosine ligase-like protein [Leishmania mexicana MHOM/GT/2001/U1103]|uniref:Tubulin-tyrosine ligase-like protein n=1 Tax=Leishmania mexicana (strain MHOM/GT/2001/U1103) TaxID=929439 RepID=E9B101_LEIMU|nr:tubulin-tyrosine ligase-like protein [Leishmania mexicana MHOM/GT/2001/U1103]CBZ28906.1 tubulin-tyrosine ligase-like protein [Leishmania mexicana MHOM/GT/2001/U1103]